MARHVAFLPTATANTVATLSLADIPQDVKDECEEIYAALKTNPNGKMRASFDSKVELMAYVTQVTSYCAQRLAEDGKTPAPIRYRKSPTKGLKDTEMDFRITDVVTENEAVTEAIRQATAAANANGQNATPPADPTPATPAKTAGKRS